MADERVAGVRSAGVDIDLDGTTDRRALRSALTALVEAIPTQGCRTPRTWVTRPSRPVLGLDGLDDAAPVPRAGLAAARDLGRLSDAVVPAVTTRLDERYGAATSGPAAEHQPALITRASCIPSPAATRPARHR